MIKTEQNRYHNATVTILLALASASLVLLPSAATNTLFALATLTTVAHPKFWKNAHQILKNPPLVTLLALFTLLALSMIWADASIGESLHLLKKHREFLLIPVFYLAIQLTGGKKAISTVLYAALTLSAIITCIAFAMKTTLQDWDYSLYTRIFFSISTSFLAYWAVLLALNNSGLKRVLHIIVALIAVVSLLAIVQGRTGYVTLLGLGILLAARRSTPAKSLAILVCTTLIFVVAYNASPIFQERIDRTVKNIGAYFNQNKNNTSVGLRLDFYKHSITIIKEHPLRGSGVGDFPSDYTRVINGTASKKETKDPHNEYIMLAATAGIPATLLFLAFLALVARQALVHQRGSLEGELLLGVAVTIFLSCLFNSSMLAHRDGAFLMILTALFMMPKRQIHQQSKVTKKEGDTQSPLQWAGAVARQTATPIGEGVDILDGAHR